LQSEKVRTQSLPSLPNKDFWGVGFLTLKLLHLVLTIFVPSSVIFLPTNLIDFFSK